MDYDFETMTNRFPSGSEKWASMYRIKPDVPDGIIPFSMADMEFKTAPEIVQAMKQYLDTYPLGYNCPTSGYLEAVAGWMKKRHSWDIDTEWILPIPGVLCGLYAAIQTFTAPGDGVIYCSPVFGPFQTGIAANKRTPVSSPLLWEDETWKIDFDDLEKKASDPKNKMLVFCNPHNPLGHLWSKEELMQIGRICARYQVLIFSDEIHSDLVMPGYTHKSFGGLDDEIDRLLLVGTAPTKTFNLAGTQVGNLIVSNSMLRKTLQGQLLCNGIFTVSAMGFRACEIAYRYCEDWLEQCIRHIYENHQALKAYASQMLPQLIVYDLQATYLQWMDFRALCQDSKELDRKLNFEANVFLDPGYEFGTEGDGFARMNLACTKEILLDAMERIHTVFRK